MSENLETLMQDTTFQWSSFDPRFPAPFGDSEYESPKIADSRIKIEDGEIAWDTRTASYPGDPMRKILVGIYATDDGFVGGKWNAKARNLVGAATVKDWEFDRFVGFDEGEEFTEDLVLARLEEELEIINAHT